MRTANITTRTTVTQALLPQVDERSAELAGLRGQLAAHDGEVDAVRAQVMAELDDARQRLAAADAMTDSYR